MSLYANYLRERTNDSIIETDRGFATYRFLRDQAAVYIIDIYVLPEHRKSGEASRLADEVAKIAAEEGLTKMIGSVQVSANNSTDSVKVLLAYGMSVKSAGNDYILFEKPMATTTSQPQV